MKETIIKWNIVELKNYEYINLPKEKVDIYFLDNDDNLGIGYIENVNNKYFVYLPRRISPWDDVAGAHVKVLLQDVYAGFKWSYTFDAITQEDDIFKRHPKIKTLLQARQYANLSQSKTASLLGVSKRSIEDWERGLHKSSVEQLIIKELLRIGEEKEQQKAD